jgi:hypothetical protein
MGVDHPLAQLDGVRMSVADLENITATTARRFLRLS